MESADKMLEELRQKCQNLDIAEKRSATEDYDELVFFNKELEQWSEILEQLLGPPKKPTGAEPSLEDLQLTEDFGGIHSNQTLYKKDLKDSTVIAMLWPWQDNVHTTLKVVVLKKDG